MINWPEQSLYFAVIDGENPREWRPWEQEDYTYGALIDECTDALVRRNTPDDEPKAHFRPLTDPIEELLQSDRLKGVIGVIIDASADPADIAKYESKMKLLERLCLHIRHGATMEELLVNKLAFEVWFFVDGVDFHRWSDWDARAKNIVASILKEMPRVEWVPSGSAFSSVARRLLTDSRFYMLYGKKP